MHSLDSTSGRRRWRLWHSVLLGVALAILISVLDLLNQWWSQRQILGIRAPISGLLLTDVDAFTAFKQDLAFHYETRAVTLVISKVTSTFLHDQFPNYFFLKVHSARSLFGIPVSQYGGEAFWAVSRTGSPNWCFRGSPNRLNMMFAFLAGNEKQIRNVEDAEDVRRICEELRGVGNFFEEAAGEHEQVDEHHWRVAGSRTLDGKLSVLEVVLGPNKVIETGWFDAR